MQRKTMLGIAGAALIAAAFGGAKLRAQMPFDNVGLAGNAISASSVPPADGFDTPEIAASSFISVVEYAKKNPDAVGYGIDSVGRYVSFKDEQLLGQTAVRDVLRELFKLALMPRLRATTQQRSGNSAVVGVVPETSDEGYKPVVCIQENGRWRIDLVATYARWNDLDEKTALRQISSRLFIPIAGVPLDANVSRGMCQSNLKQIALGTLQYAQDYDEKYPPSNRWNDAILPYVKSEQIYNCPSITNSKYGYAMNWRLSRKSFGGVQSPSQTATFYDSRTLKRNAIGSSGKDIAFRHSGGANFAYADGHVKFSRPEKVPSFLLNPNAKK